MQQKWVRKLRDYDYKKAQDNLVVDALFHTFDSHVSLSLISMSLPTWLHSLQQGYVNESSLSRVIQHLANNPSVVPHYSWDGFSLRYTGRLVLPQSIELKHAVCYELHAWAVWEAHAPHYVFSNVLSR